MRLPVALAASALALTIASCGGSAGPPSPVPPPSAPVSPTTEAPRSSTTAPEAISPTTNTEPLPAAQELERPEWLGQRVLPLRADGFGEVQPTPAVLVDRRLPTIDLLTPPLDESWVSAVRSVPDEVVNRSTWSAACPVTLEELAYLTMVFWGFDDQPHRGEMIVNASVAGEVVSVFEQLYELRFPIEEMRVVAAEELDLPPTGDGNNTTAFVCRPVTDGSGWSQHAFGLAIDINPFHNPFHKGDLVIPELASSYTDRSVIRPGMILQNGEVVNVMEEIGWGWGGAWSSLTDPMHFSQNGH